MDVITGSGIYSIRHLDTGKIYVGSASDIRRRWSEHCRELKRNDHDNEHLQHTWNKYGDVSFVWDVLVRCSAEDLIFYEQRVLDYYTEVIGWRMMFNSSPAAGSRLGSKHNDETRAKMSANNTRHFLGKKHSPQSLGYVDTDEFENILNDIAGLT